MKQFIISCLLALVLSSPAAMPAGAQPVAAPKQAWEAMGALFRNGEEYCKVTLITSTLALTAAHCVAEPSGEVLVDDVSWAVQFPSTRRIEIVDAAVMPNFRYGSLDAAPIDSLAGDVAVIALARSVDILPINLMGYEAQKDDLVWVPGPRWQRCMAHPGRTADVFFVGCLRTRGQSGWPIFRIDEQGIHIVGVITAEDPLGDGIFAHSIHIALAHLVWVYGGPDQEG